MAAFEVLQAFFASSIITLVVSQQPIISVDVIKDGGTFDITCDASRIADLDPNVSDLKVLTLSRQTAQDSSFVMFAEYRTDSWFGNRRNFPSRRRWTAYFTGFNRGINNTGTMSNVVQVRDARCEDAGMYRCEVTYNNSTGVQETMSTTQNVSAKMGVTDLTLSVNKYRAMTVRGGLRYAEYRKGVDTNLTCTFAGEEEYKIQWKQGKVVGSSVLNITDYPNDTDISTSDPTYTTSNGPCVEYEHKSVLNLGSLSEDNDHIMYMCVVKENGQSNATEEARDTITMTLPLEKISYTDICVGFTLGDSSDCGEDNTRCISPPSSDVFRCLCDGSYFRSPSNSCEPLSFLAVKVNSTQVTSEMATFTWNADNRGIPVNYTVTWSSGLFSSGSGTIDYVNSTGARLYNLQPDTRYRFYLKTIVPQMPFYSEKTVSTTVSIQTEDGGNSGARSRSRSTIGGSMAGCIFIIIAVVVGI